MGDHLKAAFPQNPDLGLQKTKIGAKREILAKIAHCTFSIVLFPTHFSYCFIFHNSIRPSIA